MKRLYVLAIIVWCGGVLASGQEAPALGDLGWMAGHWVGHSGDVGMEEFWTTPDGGVMVGLHRDVFPDGSSFFEYLRIVTTKRGLTYIASPKGTGTTEFVLVSLDGQSVVFENPEHDFPQRIIYRRVGDQLKARIEGEVNGVLKTTEWVWDLVQRDGPETEARLGIPDLKVTDRRVPASRSLRVPPRFAASR